MRIGVPKEIKVHEYRIGLVPAAARELVEAGHEVTVQTGGASGIGFSDADYQRVGAKIAATAEEIFDRSEMIVKVKEPQPRSARNCTEARFSTRTCISHRIRSRPRR